MAEDVGAAAGHVHQGALLAQAESRGDGQHQGDGLHDQGPLAQVAPDDEAAQDGLDLGEGERKHSRMRSNRLPCSDWTIMTINDERIQTEWKALFRISTLQS